MAGPTSPLAVFTTLPAERTNAPGIPQELRENTKAPTADHFRIRFIGTTIHIPDSESSGRNESIETIPPIQSGTEIRDSKNRVSSLRL
jgi:hypothetical protein